MSMTQAQNGGKIMDFQKPNLLLPPCAEIFKILEEDENFRSIPSLLVRIARGGWTRLGISSALFFVESQWMTNNESGASETKLPGSSAAESPAGCVKAALKRATS
jgi:hypothetical protein